MVLIWGMSVIIKLLSLNKTQNKYDKGNIDFNGFLYE